MKEKTKWSLILVVKICHHTNGQWDKNGTICKRPSHDYSALFTYKLSIEKAIAAEMKLLGHDCTHNEDSWSHQCVLAIK